MPNPTPPPPKYEQIGRLPAEVPTVGSFLAAVGMAGIEADSAAKDAAMNRIIALTTPDKDGKIPSLTFAAGVDIPASLTGGKADLKLGASFDVPKVIIEPDRMLVPTKITADWHLNIHSTATDESDITAHEQGSGEASIGWGPFKATVKIEASASESEQHKRTTDDTATLDAHMEMGQLAVSEGQAMILSSLRRVVNRGVEVVDKLAQKEATNIARQAGVATPADDGTQVPADGGGSKVGGGKGG